MSAGALTPERLREIANGGTRSNEPQNDPFNDRVDLARALLEAWEGHAFTKTWYSLRFDRLRELAVEHDLWPEVACIFANGTENVTERPQGQRIHALRAQVETLTAALGPFAEMHDRHYHDITGAWVVHMGDTRVGADCAVICVRDLRAAARALETQP